MTVPTVLRPAPARRPTWARVGPVALCLGAAGLLGACGASSTANTALGTNSPPTTTPAPPGTSGTLAAVSPSSSSMEVQNPQTGQTTVTWSGTTTFTQTQLVGVSALSAGQCVMATGTPASPGSTPSPITARSITIVPAAADGTCSARPGAEGGFAGRGFGGFGRSGFARGGGGTPGSGSTPSSVPDIAIAFGSVSSVSSSSIVVHGTEHSGFGRRPPGSTSSSSSAPTTTVAPSDITVDTDSSTTVTQTSGASASALAVGQCVSAVGPADSTGAVSANSVSIRPPVNGSCGGGFGRFSGGLAGPDGGPTGGGSTVGA